MAYKFRSQTEFSAGALSKLQQGRHDSKVYAAAVKEMENFIPVPDGPAIKRPGTYFATAAASNTPDGSRLISFYFGEGQAYVLEFYNDNIRILTGDGLLYINGTTNAFVIASTGYDATKIHEIDIVQSADVLYITHKDVPLKKIERTIPISGDTGYADRAADGTYWALSNVLLTDGPWDALNTDNSKLLSIAVAGGASTTWKEIGGVGLDTTQNKFSLFGHGLRNGMAVRFKAGGTIGNLVQASGSGAPFIVSTSSTTTRYHIVNAGSSSFSLATAFEGPPKTFKLDTTLTEVEWTGNLTIEKEVIDKGTNCTITASSSVFQAEDDTGAGFPDALLRVNLYCGSEDEKTKGVKWVSFKITAQASATSITAVPQSEVTLFGRDTREFEFGALGGRFGYARKCAIHQQRLILAASEEKPTTLWLSNSGNFENFSPDTAIGVNTGESDSAGQSIVAEQILDDNSLNLTIDSDTVDRIYWLAEKDRLEIGTSGGPFHLYGSETSRTITPLNFTIQKASAWECADVAPVRVGNALVYAQLGNRKVRGMGRDQGGAYVAADLSSTSDYFQSNSIDFIAHQKQPHSLIWIARDDGRLVTMSFDERDEFAGFALHTIGGSHVDATHGDHAKVESIAIIPRTPDDRLWMIVKRDINGSVVRHIEFMQNFFLDSRDTQQKAHFVDAGYYTESGSTITSITGLGHLEGETLDVLANGGVFAPSPTHPHTVSSGVITFPEPTAGGTALTKMVTGLPYVSKIHTLPVRTADDNSVFPLGRVRMIKAHLRFSESLAVQVGLETLSLEEVLFRTTQDPSGSVAPLFTGTKIMSLVGRTEEDESLRVISSGPLPLTLLNLITEHEVNIQ